MRIVDNVQLADTGAAPSSAMAGGASSLEWLKGPRPERTARINVFEIKEKLLKCVGHECADRYFLHFRSFIGARLSKYELDKLVVHTIGHENVALHNQLVKAILSNAVNAVTAPLISKDVARVVTSERVDLPTCLVANDGLSSCKVTSFERDLRCCKGLNNGIGTQKESPVPDLSRLGAPDELGMESSVPSGKRLRVLYPVLTEVARPLEIANQAVCMKDMVVKDSEYVRIPLAMPLCSEARSQARRADYLAFPLALLMQEVRKEDHVDVTELPDTESLLAQMVQIALLEGLGVNKECADLLNGALDCFLMKLIKACVDVVKYRRLPAQQCLQSALHAQKRETKTSGPSIFLKDFKVAMDLNCEQLGEDWPVQLEKLGLCLFNQESSSS